MAYATRRKNLMKMLNNILLLFVVFVILTQIYGYNEPRINNGEITPPDLFQFTVYLHSLGSGCTGTIISKRHVLTAGHFIYDIQSLKIEYDTYKVYLKIPYFAEVRPISTKYDKLVMPMSIKAYLPKTYVWPEIDGLDIAILEFPEGTDFGVEPVKLAKDYVEKDGDEAYITGFGSWWEKDGQLSGGSSSLRHTKVSMNNFCFGTLQICGGNATHRSLPGDSGGPMVIYRNNQWYEIGICQSGTLYDYRTRISSYCNFIEEVTNGEAKCESIYPENYFNGQMLPIKHFEPIYKGKETSLKLFNFVVPLYNLYYNQGCTATVISKRHLLTSAGCVFRNGSPDENKKSHLTVYSSYKTITGKLFPDFRSKNVRTNLKNNLIDDVTAYIPVNYTWPWDHNIAVIEFPDGIDFGVEPVTLAKDHFPIYLEEGIIAGYGKYEISNDMHMKEPPILQHSNSVFGNNDMKVPPENFNLTKDEGGPILIDRNGKFYQIGVNYAAGTPNGSRTYVSSHCDFIEEVTKNEVKCESVAPIYEMPSTTFLPQYENPSNTESANNVSAMIELNILCYITQLFLVKNAFYAEFLKFSSLIVYFVASNCIVIERIWAIIYLKGYENKKDYKFIIVFIILQWAISVVGLWFALEGYVPIIICLFLAMFYTFASVLVFRYMDSKNQECYRLSKSIENVYTLTERYQIAENHKTAPLITAMINANVILNTLILIALIFLFYSQTVFKKQISKMIFDFLITFHSPILSSSCIYSIKKWRNVCKGIFVKTSNHKITPRQDTVTYNNNKNNTKTSALPRKTEADIYFKQLNDHWA